MIKNKAESNLEAQIHLTQEWMASGVSQAEFAKIKGIKRSTLGYRISRARELAPERLTAKEIPAVDFAQIPKEYLQMISFDEDTGVSERPLLTIQSHGNSLHTTNGIEPCLLKAALEVMLDVK